MKEATPHPESISAKNTHQAEIPSGVAGIRLAEKLIDTLCTTHKIDENQYGNIYVAVREAVTNAIYHGNKQTQEKKLKLNTLFHRKKLIS